MRTSFCYAALTVTFLASGCQNLDELAAQEAADSEALTSSEAAVVAVQTDDMQTGLSAAALAERAEAKIGERLFPAGCVTVSRDGLVVTSTLRDCSGRHGFLHVTGTIVAEFSDADTGVRVHLAGKALEVNGGILDLDTNGLVSDADGKRVLTVETNGAGTGPRGHSFVRSGRYTAVRDAAADCATLDGEWTLTVEDRSRTTTVTGLRRCDGMCPAAGGRIVHTGFRGRTITVTFDGSSEAAWSSSTGRSGTVDLRCGDPR